MSSEHTHVHDLRAPALDAIKALFPDKTHQEQLKVLHERTSWPYGDASNWITEVRAWIKRRKELTP